MNVKGWKIFFFQSFNEIYTELVTEVHKLRQKDSEGYKSHPKTKLLASIQKVIFNDVPGSPHHRKFTLGKTLDRKYRDWCRVKHGLPPRYRLFFRYHSAEKTIIYVWFNDELTLRRKGNRHDVYAVFQKMLDRGDIPNEYEYLIKTSRAPL